MNNRIIPYIPLSWIMNCKWFCCYLKAGYTPLHTACHFAKINMINFLLRYGANINAKTKLGYTPLHMGAQQGHVLVVKVLLKNNANADELTSVRMVLLCLLQHLDMFCLFLVL